MKVHQNYLGHNYRKQPPSYQQGNLNWNKEFILLKKIFHNYCTI